MSRTRAPEARIVLSAPFAAALLTLVVNDHALKPLFHNALTGKLSDFAGLFAFALFWCALLPAWRTAACLTTAALWVWWKLPLSQPALDAWNALGVYHLARVADAGDLVALAVLPPAWAYAGRHSGARPRRPSLRAAERLAHGALCMVSVFAFAATSRAYRYGPTAGVDRDSIVPPVSVSLEYVDERELAIPKRLFVRRLQLLFSRDFPYDRFSGRFRGPEADSLTVTVVPPPPRCRFVWLEIEVREEMGRAVVRPLRAYGDCETRSVVSERAMDAFQEQVLRATTTGWKPEYDRGGVLGLPPMPVEVDSARVPPPRQ